MADMTYAQSQRIILNAVKVLERMLRQKAPLTRTEQAALDKYT
jgi:hypothetical protein